MTDDVPAGSCSAQLRTISFRYVQIVCLRRAGPELTKRFPLHRNVPSQSWCAPTVSLQTLRVGIHMTTQVARRRLKRPPRRSAHLSTHRARVSLAQAGIDRVAAKVDQDVANMRSEIERDDEQRENQTDVEPDDEVEVEVESPLGTKVAGD